MNLRIRFEEEADAEYRAAGRWYETHRNGLGREFLDAVDATLQQLQAFPDSGVPVPRLPADLPVRRLAVRRFPYHVVYLKMPDALRVLAVAHDRRKPSYWKGRLG